MNAKKSYKRTKLLFGMATLTSVTICLAFIHLTSSLKNTHNTLYNNCLYIAHGGGEISGERYLNCEEALLLSLQKGYKHIELDLCMTTDNNVVCSHDWRHFRQIAGLPINDTALSLTEFEGSRILGKYMPLSLQRVIEIKREHPFTLVTDKISDVGILNRYFDATDRPSVMVEAFSWSDYSQLKQAGYIPMMSLGKFDYENIFWDFVYSKIKYDCDIDWVCVNTSSNMKSLRMAKRLFSCKVAMYTSNSETFISEHLGREVDLIYTDNWDFNTRKKQ